MQMCLYQATQKIAALDPVLPNRIQSFKHDKVETLQEYCLSPK